MLLPKMASQFKNRHYLITYIMSVFVLLCLSGCFISIGKANNQSRTIRNEIDNFYAKRKAWNFEESDRIWLDLMSKDSLIISDLIVNRRLYEKNSWVWFSKNRNFFMSELTDPRRILLYTVCLFYYGDADYYQCSPEWICSFSFSESSDFHLIWLALDKWFMDFERYGLSRMRSLKRDPLYYSNCTFKKIDVKFDFDED